MTESTIERIIESASTAASEADSTALENACRDIDRYIAEISQPPGDRPVSPSERLQALGRHQVGSLQPSRSAALLEPPPFPDRP